MTKEIRSPNVEGRSGGRSPDSSFGFWYSFGFRHSSFGFQKSGSWKERSEADPQALPCPPRATLKWARSSLDSARDNDARVSDLCRRPSRIGGQRDLAAVGAARFQDTHWQDTR